MRKDERGSILPLGIGVLALSLIFSLTMIELIGIQYQTMQVKQIADVAALQVGEDLYRDHIPPVKNLDYSPTVTETVRLASEHLRIMPKHLEVFSSDGKTIAATACVQWRSITGFSLGNFGNLCATSKARAI